MDNQVLLREGLARLLAEAEMNVVASEGDIGGFLGAVAAHHILTSRSSTSGCRPRLPTKASAPPTKLRTRHPGTAVLVLSQYLNAGYALRLLESLP